MPSHFGGPGHFSCLRGEGRWGEGCGVVLRNVDAMDTEVYLMDLGLLVLSYLLCSLNLCLFIVASDMCVVMILLRQKE